MTKLLVIDTETGGLDPAKHSILTLAAVVWEDKQILDSIDIKIWEGSAVSTTPRAMEINQIDLEELEKVGLSPVDACAKLLEFVGKHFNLEEYNDAVLVGHNIGFDVGFSKRLFTKAGLYWPKVFGHRTLDTQSVLQFLMVASGLPLTSTSSATAFEFFGVQPEHAHRALDDATSTAKLLTKLVELVDSPVASE